MSFKLPLGIVALLVTVLPIQIAVAQDKPEPSVVIAVAPVDEQLNDVEYLAGAMSETFGQMSGIARIQAQGYLRGVDFSKPAGALLYFKEGNPEPDAIGIFPVKNLDDVLDQISNFAELDEGDDTVTIIPDAGEELTLVKKGDYAFVSEDAAMLKNLPADPAKMLAEQTKDYNLSAKLYPQRIPAEMRDMAIDWLQENYEMSLDQMDEFQAEIQEAQFEMQMKQVEMLVNEVDLVTMGFNADKEKERVYFDFQMKGLTGSDFQKRIMAGKSKSDSLFTGFLMEKAALTFHNCSGISEEDAKIYVESMESMRDTLLDQIDEEEDEVASELANKIGDKLVNVLKKTLMAGTMDMGGVIFTDDGLNASIGAKVVDVADLESSIKEIVGQAESKIEDDEVVFNLNSGSHGGFSLHEILITLDPDEVDEPVIAMLGEQMKVILGFGKDQLYLGFGKNPESTLKKSIDANAGAPKKADIMGQYNIFLAPIMGLVAEIETEEEMVQLLKDKIQEVGKDRVRVTWDVVDGAVRGRMEMQDGIFRMFGAMAESMSGMGGGADF